MQTPTTTPRTSTLQRLHLAVDLLTIVLVFQACASGSGHENAGDVVKDTGFVSDQATNDAKHVNHKPYMEPIGDRKLPVGKLGVIAIEADDPDKDVLTYFIAGNLPDGAKFNKKTGVFTWKPKPAQKGLTTMLTFGVSDGIAQASETIMIEVVTGGENHAPVMDPIGTLIAQPGKHFQYRLRASDPDGDALTYSVSGPKPGGFHVDRDRGTCDWEVPADADGRRFVVLFAVSDGELSATSEAHIVVQGGTGNQPPKVDQDMEAEFIPDKDNLFQIQANDPDGDKLTYKLLKPQPLPDGLKISDQGELSWKPGRDWAGKVLLLTGEVSDGKLGVVFNVSITIKDVYPPVIQMLGKPEQDQKGVFLAFTIQDEGEIDMARLVFHTDAQDQDKNMDLVDIDGQDFGVILPLTGAKNLYFYCEAMDKSGNKTRFPDKDYMEFNLQQTCPQPTHPIFVRVYYDPLARDETKQEFVWLYNPTDKTVDLTGWAIADDQGNGDWYMFPDKLTIEPHKYLQLARDLDGYSALFDEKLVPDLDDFNLNLTNKGDCLVLVNKAVDIVDQVCWERGAKSGCTENWGLVWADAGKALLRGSTGQDGYQFSTCDTDTAMDWTSDLYDVKPWPEF